MYQPLYQRIAAFYLLREQAVSPWANYITSICYQFPNSSSFISSTCFSNNVLKCTFLTPKLYGSIDITLLTKVHVVKAMVFLVVMYRCESWTIRKAKHQRIDAFKLVLEKTLESPLWTARRLNQSILNIH